jgi:hypothetical protein
MRSSRRSAAGAERPACLLGGPPAESAARDPSIIWMSSQNPRVQEAHRLLGGDLPCLFLEQLEALCMQGMGPAPTCLQVGHGKQI